MPNERDDLTPRQKRFAKEYVKTGNASESARRAGYSKRRAGQTGHETVKKREVQAYMDELAADADIIKGLTIEQIASMLMKEARTAETDGARVRAQELLGKWKGAFVEKYEDLTNRDSSPESLLTALGRVSPEAARVLAVQMGIPWDDGHNMLGSGAPDNGQSKLTH